MKMIPVNSSAITHIGYDKDTKKMKITFKGSGTYDYCNVQGNVFESFINASSIGSHYSRYIKDKYNCL